MLDEPSLFPEKKEYSHFAVLIREDWYYESLTQMGHDSGVKVCFYVPEPQQVVYFRLRQRCWGKDSDGRYDESKENICQKMILNYKDGVEEQLRYMRNEREPDMVATSGGTETYRIKVDPLFRNPKIAEIRLSAVDLETMLKSDLSLDEAKVYAILEKHLAVKTY